MRAFLVALAFVGLAHAAPPALTWSLTDHSPAIAVSGASAARSSSYYGQWQIARSEFSQSTGVRYVEFTILQVGGGAYGLMVGVASGAAPTNQRAGYDMNGVSYWSIGQTIKNNTWTGVVPPAFTTGDVIGMSVDLNAHTVKFNKNAGAYSATIDIASLGPDVFVAVTLGDPQPYGSVQVTADDWNDFTAPTLNIIGHGDSLSNTAGVQKGYLPRLADLIRQDRKGWASWTRAGINGASWNFAWSQAGYPYTLTQDIAQRVVPALSPSIPNWVIAFAGTNGFALAFHSVATEYANLQADVNALIAAGVPANRIIVPTMLPRTGLSETTRTAYNAAIVADAGAIGYKLARLDLNADIGAAGQNTNTTWFLDGTHPTDAGHAVIASIIYALIYP